MDKTAASNFDRFRDFTVYWKADPVGATTWLLHVANAAHAQCDELSPVRALIPKKLSDEEERVVKEQLLPLEPMLIEMGRVISAPLGQLAPDALKQIGWRLPPQLWPPVIAGQVRIEQANEDFRATTRNTASQSVSRPLERMITLNAGNVKRALTCPNDPLECMGSDVSVFEGAFDVAVRAWPDRSGRLFVQEVAPIMNHPDYTSEDFASGRLFAASETEGTMSLRVNAEQFIEFDDPSLHKALRPFVGTGVIVYGKRHFDESTGRVRLASVSPNCWVLCRLTDPKDEANNIPQAPLPQLQGDICLCIGATPPWNWSGPNIRTHILAPIHALGLVRTTERRFVFGQILRELPVNIQNPLPEVKRAFQASAITERDTDIEAHWATRLGPVETVVQDLTAIAFLTSATTIAEA